VQADAHGGLPVSADLLSLVNLEAFRRDYSSFLRDYSGFVGGGRGRFGLLLLREHPRHDAQLGGRCGWLDRQFSLFLRYFSRLHRTNFSQQRAHRHVLEDDPRHSGTVVGMFKWKYGWTANVRWENGWLGTRLNPACCWLCATARQDVWVGSPPRPASMPGGVQVPGLPAHFCANRAAQGHRAQACCARVTGGGTSPTLAAWGRNQAARSRLMVQRWDLGGLGKWAKSSALLSCCVAFDTML
jgi:hypothetical protein